MINKLPKNKPKYRLKNDILLRKSRLTLVNK